MKNYEYRLLVFIDILGFSESIKKSNDDESEVQRIYDTVSNLRECFKSDSSNLKELGVDNQVVQVSDSLVISKLFNEQGGLFSLLLDCSYAIHHLITFGYLCRGVVKFGKLFHEKDLIFGQAFIDAYKEESKMTLPVIKVDKELLNLIDHFPGDANIGNEEWAKDLIKKNLRQLNDKEFFVDYFTDYDDIISEGDGHNHYKKLRQIILEGLSKNQDSSAYLKYLWAAKEFNRTCEIYGNEKINIDLSKDA